MADRVSASIVLGGSLSTSAFTELVEIIGNEGLSTEWDGEGFEPHHRTVGQPLSLFAHEVAGGYFDELESWCARNQIPFADGPAAMAASGAPSGSSIRAMGR